MSRIREEVSIDAPPEAVWRAVHEDLAAAPRWAAYLRSAEALDGPPGPGSRVRYELELPGGMRVDLVMRHVTWDRPRHCRGTFDDGPLQGTWEYRYARQGDGTHLTYEMDYELRGVLRLAGGLLRGQYAAGIRQGMSMLKSYVEETTGTAHRRT